MKTVSTLCATSTVGIAACGFALARPCTTANDFNDQLTNITIPPNNRIPPVIREPVVVGAFPNTPTSCITPTSETGPQQPNSPHLFPPSHVSRPSTSRRWLSRLSESFSSGSSSTSSYPSSSTQSSSTTSSSRSRPYTSSAFSPFSSNPNSRPPTRNKLVKRAPSQRHSATGGSALAAPSQRQRPHTAVNQLSPAVQSSHLSPIHASRPSTSAPETIFSPRQTYTPEPVDSWRVFFSAKRQKLTSKHSSGSSSGGGRAKLQKKSFRGVRRIYPDQRGRNVMGPTLMLAPTMCNMDRSSNDADADAESIFSGGESLFFDSRPASRMDDLCVERSRERPATSVSPPSSSRRRSLSISNYLSAPTSKNPSEDGEIGNEEGDESGYVGSYAMDFGFAQRYSEAASAYPRHTRPSSPEGREPAAPISSLSLLEEYLAPVSRDYSPSLDDHLESLSPVDPHHDIDIDLDLELGATNLTPIQTTNRQHRLSLISGSERASTLVGSEDLNNFESDQSDTVFDSMRTRVSEPTPVRADTIFDVPDGPPHSQDISPRDTRYSHKRYMSGDYTPLKQTDIATASSRNGITTHRMAFDDDEDGWSSDWDVQSKNGDDDGELRIPTQGGLRPYSGLLSAASLGLHSNNASSTSFGTAPEAFSVDGASIRETNSILDWSESVPNNTAAAPPSYAKRSKTIHAKESMLTSTRAGRRAPSYHVRSQSMPLVNTHGRVPLPSENWDDDFLDDEDESSGFGMVIPRAIEENQASVIGHLGCVREFALLVEDLKQIREQAILSGARFGAHKGTFDEADGIIALATLDDDEPLPPQPSEPPPKSRNTSWNHSPSSRPSILPDDGMPKGYNQGRRRSSVLSPDDDIFGGSGNNLTPLRHHHSFRASPTPSPASRKTIDRNDPVEVAKGIMERMQQQHQHSGAVHHVRGQSDDTVAAGKTKKVQFDTDMLRELVKHVGKLKRTLQGVIEREREVEEECRSSFEGFEDGWDFRAAVGVV